MRWAAFVESAHANDESVLQSSKKVAIMGGGSFGTAMATLLARNKADLDVVILMRNEDDARALNEEHRNVKYLPKYSLPVNIRASTDAKEALAGCDFHHSRRSGATVAEVFGGGEGLHRSQDAAAVLE